MSYSRSCGVSLAACGAQTCRCDKSHVDALGGREKPAQRFEFVPDVVHCAACEALAHDNPLQTAHNESRYC